MHLQYLFHKLLYALNELILFFIRLQKIIENYYSIDFGHHWLKQLTNEKGIKILTKILKIYFLFNIIMQKCIKAFS